MIVLGDGEDRENEGGPRLKPLHPDALFRWTEVQLPLLKQGAPSGEAQRPFERQLRST